MGRINREKEHFDCLYQSPKLSKYLLDLQVKEAGNYLEKANFIKKIIPNVHELSVLEVGCRRGNLTNKLHTSIPTYIAIDVSSNILKNGKEIFSNLRFAQMAVEQLGFKKEVFDVVVGCGILHHLNLELALPEIHTILKPHGYFIFFEPNLYFVENWLINKFSIFRKYSTLSEDEDIFTKEYIFNILKDQGFQNVEVKLLFTYHPKLPRGLLSLTRTVNKLLEKLNCQYFSRELLIIGQKG